jgi:hypothetical protein
MTCSPCFFNQIALPHSGQKFGIREFTQHSSELQHGVLSKVKNTDSPKRLFDFIGFSLLFLLSTGFLGNPFHVDELSQTVYWGDQIFLSLTPRLHALMKRPLPASMTS